MEKVEVLAEQAEQAEQAEVQNVSDCRATKNNIEQQEDDLAEELPKEKSKIVAKELQRKFIINFKKGQEEQAELLTRKIAEVSNSPIGAIPFEDIVLYLFEEKLEESDYENIRSKAFDRKIDSARVKYNRDNKINYTMKEFLASAMEKYLH